ncbi:transporter substrate-binding domain-containing protein [Rheinheimera sediminis]|uniref:substrate-binding periplasmic protein n=1 Tax=Rheinheimera sp. YQF-1 TaxID=2499626 RepID=UPI000FD7BF14|nr:transporter substrate-binding domain-containing protein [Rheinheimera sp. YQF-1]RVT48676.1 transporter substrate-binding domain-containing protein [Rheinheimera sp. YQF-1]
MWKWALLLLPCLTWSAESLRAVVSQTNTAPYAIFDEHNSLADGVAKDLLDELAVRLKMPILYLDLPRGRVVEWLVTDQADISCFLNPEWVPATYKLNWTPILFHTRQYIIRRIEDGPVRSNKDLFRKRIGTTRGFSYPELQQLFVTGSSVRDDAESLEKNIQRLEQGRIDVVMTVDLSYGHYQQHFDTSKLAADPLWAEPAAVYCALNPKNALLVQKIQQQLSSMQHQKLIERMLQRWKHSSP